MVQDESKEVHYKKLHWRCRRGMKELDLFLQHFFSNFFLQLPEEEKNTFELILDLPDPELFNLLMGYKQSDCVEVNDLAEKIRNAAYT